MARSRKDHSLIYLGFILILSTLLKLPSLFEPNHYGDEGIYQTLGQAIRGGAVLYRDIWDNKPPLLYLFYALFDGDQFGIRLFSLIFALSSVVIFYLLARNLFSKYPRIALFVTLLFALAFSLPFLEGNIANAENLMILPIVSAFYLVVKHFPKISASLLLISGLLLGLAFLLKIVAVFDLTAIFLFLTVGLWPQIKKIAGASFFLSLGFVLPILITILFLLFQGTFREFLSATLAQNVGYVAWGNKLIITQGWLILKLFLLFLFCLFLFLKRGKLSKTQLLIFLWFAFSLFNAFFAQRPWIHYLLVLAPAFCLLLGSFFQTKTYRVLTMVILLATFYLAGANFWLYDKTLAYYANFASFLTGQKTVSDYRSFWGSHVNRDYRIAQFLTLKTRPEDAVFLWSNEAQIYALAKRKPATRYTVAYHFNFSAKASQETIQSLGKSQPNYFIIPQPEVEDMGKLRLLLSLNYHLFLEDKEFIVYEKNF